MTKTLFICAKQFLFSQLLFWALVMPLQAGLSDQPIAVVLPQPESGLQPQDVVKIVIRALANNDKPYKDAGIETTFNFASPANKVNTGPLQRFTKMVKGGVYASMVSHRKSEFSEVVLEGNNAYQYVRLTTTDGDIAVFAFRLGLQLEGIYRGMWMTDAVWPLNQ